MEKLNLMKKYFKKPENPKPTSCLEVGSLVGGIIILIITGLLMITICINIKLDEFTKELKAIALSSIAFAFSIILLVGLIQKRPGYVIAYLVFGVILALICLPASIIFLLETSTVREPRTTAGILYVAFLDIGHLLSIIFTTICCVYSLYLIMLGFTCKKLVNDIQFDDTVPLTDIRYNEIK